MEENREFGKDSIRGHGNDIGDGFDQEIERGRSEKDIKKNERRRIRIPKKINPKEAKYSEPISPMTIEPSTVNNKEEKDIEARSKNLPCETKESFRNSTPKEKSKKQKTPRNVTRVGRFCIIFATFCFVCGVLILAAVIGSGRTDANEEIDELTQNEDGAAQDDGSDIVLNNDENTEDILLSKAEIYSRNIDGVVSISTEMNGATGIGSGFFVSDDGYVATAAHVVENANTVWVILASGKRVEATVVAENEFSDVALLKVDGEGYKPLTFGLSGSLEIGETVTAIGTPASLEYAGSLSSGEVSYNNRILKVYDGDGALTKKMKVIQTNAQVNPGNSGCPLFNSKGEVVGMVSMKLGRDYEGLGFALPAEGVKRIIDAMASGNELDFDILGGVSIPVPRLGISGAEYSLGGIIGVEIVGFTNNEQGAVKVLKTGDVITEIDGESIDSTSRLSEVIGKHRPSDKVAVTVYRKGQHLTFSVTLY